MVYISCHFRPLKPLTLRMDHAKLLGILASLPVSQSILPRVVCFARSCPANHAICSYINSSGYASWPIRRCLFIGYIIKLVGFGSVWAFQIETGALRRFQNEAAQVSYAVIKMLVSAIHIAHCMQEMIAISSDACYQILSCAHV